MNTDDLRRQRAEEQRLRAIAHGLIKPASAPAAPAPRRTYGPVLDLPALRSGLRRLCHRQGRRFHHSFLHGRIDCALTRFARLVIIAATLYFGGHIVLAIVRGAFSEALR